MYISHKLFANKQQTSRPHSKSLYPQLWPKAQRAGRKDSRRRSTAPLPPKFNVGRLKRFFTIAVNS